MSKDKKGGKQDNGNLGGGSSSKALDPFRAEAEKQWKIDFGRKPTRFNHSESGPFTPPLTKGKEPSQSGPTSVGGSSSNNNGGATNPDYEFLRGVENLEHLQRDSIKIDQLNQSQALSRRQEAPSSPTASSSSSMVSSPTPSESPASTSGSSGLGGVNDKSNNAIGG